MTSLLINCTLTHFTVSNSCTESATEQRFALACSSGRHSEALAHRITTSTHGAGKR